MASWNSLSMPRLQQEPTNLLNLPLELQLHIYEYTLSDPNLWDRRHRDGCDLRPLTERVMNQPPFMWHRVVVDAVPKHGPREKVALSNMYALPKAFSLARTWTACDCGKRRGIHLLRTNRHIFSVAAKMLWSRGSLCFFDATEFAACVEATSPGTRTLIRGVSIMSFIHGARLDSRVCLRSQSDNGQDCPSAVYPWSTRCLPVFWRALQLLPGLQHLAIPHGYLDGSVFLNMADDQFFKIKAYLARLGYIDLTHLNVAAGDWDYRPTYFGDSKYFWADFFSGGSLASLYGFSERIDTTTWLYDDTNREADDPRHTFYHKINLRHSHNFVYRAFRAMQTQVMEQDSTTIAGTHWWRPQARVIAGDGTATVLLTPLGTLKVVVTFYNVPLSRDACVKSNIALASHCAELEKLGRRFEAGQRKRNFAREEIIRRFEALRLEETYAFEGVEGKLRIPKPIIEKSRTKRVRIKKNRRGYRKRGVWQE